MKKIVVLTAVLGLLGAIAGFAGDVLGFRTKVLEYANLSQAGTPPPPVVVKIEQVDSLVHVGQPEIALEILIDGMIDYPDEKVLTDKKDEVTQILEQEGGITFSPDFSSLNGYSIAIIHPGTKKGELGKQAALINKKLVEKGCPQVFVKTQKKNTKKIKKHFLPFSSTRFTVYHDLEEQEPAEQLFVKMQEIFPSVATSLVEKEGDGENNYLLEIVVME